MRIDTSSLGFLLIDAARLYRAGLEERVLAADPAISMAEVRVMVHAAANPGLRQAELAARMGIEPMTLCGLVDRLEKRGHVVRAPVPGDRWAKTVTVQPEAEPVIEMVGRVAQDFVTDLSAELAPEDIEALRALLSRLRGALTARRGAAPRPAAGASA